ncbi:MAG: CHRD domain-containing protein, partial [Pseudomonadales bacterium]|nr:CHRD domain-containing protein [Pseudomonadales bacterium]
IGGEVSIRDASGASVGTTVQTDETGQYQISFTTSAELDAPLQVVVTGDGAQSVCDVQPVCEVGTDENGDPVTASFGENYDLPAGFQIRAAIQTVTSSADDTFEARAYVSPLSEFVTAAALAMGDGQTLTDANLDVANETVGSLLTEIFPSLPVPASLEISSVPLLDLTDLAAQDPDALDELSLVMTAVSAAVASFVDAGSSSRGDIAQVIEDFSTQISANAGTEAALLAATDDALLSEASVSSVMSAVGELEAAITGGTIALPDGIAIDDFVVVYQDAIAALPEIVDIGTGLSPAQQPAQVDSPASGWADIVILPDTGEAELVLETANIEASQAHIHQGFAGTNGPVLVALEQESGNANRWRLPADTVLDAATRTAIMNGETYYNVHSETYPAGEIRGQILPDNMDAIFATPTGLEQVPEPVDSTGFARGALTIDRDTGIAQVHFTSAGIEVGAAHVHQGIAGTNGGVVIEMMQDAQNTAHWFASDVELGTELVTALDSAELYFNLHTSANPVGELRGQILPEGYKMKISLLDPDQVVSETSVSSAASGVVATTVDMATANFSAHLNTTD